MQQEIRMNTGQDNNQYAGFGLRFLAYWVDYLILFVINMAISIAFGVSPLKVLQTKTLEDLNKLNTTNYNLTVFGLGMLIGLLFYLFFWIVQDGATPGKKLLGIKIIRTNGERMNLASSLLRIIGLFISGLTFFFFGFGYLMVVWDKKKQALHDKIAGTVVVKNGSSHVALGVFVTIITIVLILAYYIASFVHGFRLGFSEALNKKNTAYSTTKSIDTSLKNMNPEAKALYDQSQEIFKQMKDESSDVTKVKTLNNKNISLLKKASELDPSNAQIWNSLGDAYTWISDGSTLEDAIASYKKAQSLDPKNILYTNSLGEMYNRLEKYDLAILEFQKTFRLTDNSGYANLGAGLAYLKLGIKDSSIECYQKALDIFTKENDKGRYDAEILQAQKGLAEAKK